MLMEVYYKHYYENCNDKYWGMEEKSIPYMVLFPTIDEMHEFINELKQDDIQCVASNHSYKALLVNLELKRCGVIHSACKHSCINDRNYTPEEFIEEVYKPWKNQNMTLS